MSGSPDSGAKTLDGSLFYDEGLHGRANRAPTPHEVPHFGIGSSIKQQQGQSPLDPQWEDKIPVIGIPSATLGSPRQYGATSQEVSPSGEGLLGGSVDEYAETTKDYKHIVLTAPPLMFPYNAERYEISVARAIVSIKFSPPWCRAPRPCRRLRTRPRRAR